MEETWSDLNMVYKTMIFKSFELHFVFITETNWKFSEDSLSYSFLTVIFYPKPAIFKNMYLYFPKESTVLKL